MATNTHSTDLEASSSQYWSITHASQTGLGMTGDFTLEAWLKVESQPATNDRYAVIGKFTSSTNDFNYNLLYEDNSGTLRFRLQTATGGSGVNSTSVNYELTNDVWYHVAVTYDESAGQMELFINGKSEGTDTGGSTNLADNGADFAIGAQNADASGAKYFDGLIDEVRVWSDIRTDSEIQDNIGTNLAGTEANLEGYWKFDNDGTDETSNGNDLTNNNTATFSTDVPFSGTLVDVKNDDTLATNLVSYWELEEASGTRTDSHGSNDLSDNNTVGQGTGKQGNCADFERGNNEHLSITDASQTGLLDGETELSIAYWWKPESNPNDEQIIMDKWNSSGNQRSFRVMIVDTGGTDYLSINVSSDGSTSEETQINLPSNYSTGTWYHHVITYNAGEISFYVDGVLAGTGSNTKTSIYNSSTDVYIGARSDGNTDRNLDGLLDEFSYHDRALTAGEAHNLYNGGSGLPYEGGTAYTQDLTEALALADSQALETGKPLTDSLTLVDSLEKVLTATRSFTENIVLDASVTVQLVLYKTVNEAITLVDSVIRDATKVVSDAITTVDSIVRDTTRALTDTVTPVDSISTVLTFTKSIAEELTLVDDIVRDVTKSVDEAITLADNLTNAITYTRAFTEVTTLVENMVLSAGRSISESVALQDTLAKVKDFGRSFTESLSLNDRLYGLLNGVNMEYVDQYAEEVGEYVDQYFNI